MQQVINCMKVIKSHSVDSSIIEVLNRRDPFCPRGPSRPDSPYLMRLQSKKTMNLVVFQSVLVSKYEAVIKELRP